MFFAAIKKRKTSACTCKIDRDGKSKSPEYNVWHKMKLRCYDENNKSYCYYGKLGVRVCTRWLNSFENFLSDMGERPSSEHSLDRIDVYSGYTPKNCKWSTDTEQARNRRNNFIVEFNGKKKCLAVWAEELKLRYGLVCLRLSRGWSVEEAFNIIQRGRPAGGRKISFAGEERTAHEWAKKLGVSAKFIWQRLERGWSVERTLTEI